MNRHPANQIMRFFKILALIVTVTVLIVLWLPGDVLEAGGRWLRQWLPWQPSPPTDVLGHTDKIVHFLLFALSGGLLAYAWYLIPGWQLWLGMIALALLTEAGQIYIPGRAGDGWDALADIAGASAAILLIRCLNLHPRQRDDNEKSPAPARKPTQDPS